jgi:hypothetical protein
VQVHENADKVECHANGGNIRVFIAPSLRLGFHAEGGGGVTLGEGCSYTPIGSLRPRGVYYGWLSTFDDGNDTFNGLDRGVGYPMETLGSVPMRVDGPDDTSVGASGSTDMYWKQGVGKKADPSVIRLGTTPFLYLDALGGSVHVERQSWRQSLKRRIAEA